MPMNRYPGAALITGASSGLGEVFAHRFAATGKDVILVARREERLQQLSAKLEAAHSIRALVVVEDLAREGAAQRIRDSVDAEGLPVGLLVNNAGFGRFEPFESTAMDQNANMVRVNCVAPVELTQLFVPDMLEAGGGCVVFTASTAGFVPTPWMAVYGATKSFNLFLAEALWAEYRGRGIDVLAVCPGVTTTGFQEVADVDGNPPGVMVATAEEVVDATLARLHKGPSFVHGWANLPTVFLSRFFPRGLVARASSMAIRGVSDKLKNLPLAGSPNR